MAARFDEDNTRFLIIQTGALIYATCWFLVAHAIRAIDNNIAPID